MNVCMYVWANVGRCRRGGGRRLRTPLPSDNDEGVKGGRGVS